MQLTPMALKTPTQEMQKMVPISPSLWEDSMEEIEAELAKNLMLEKIFIKSKLFEDLEKFFGKDVEILMN